MGKFVVNGAIDATSHITIKNGADLYLQAPASAPDDSGDLIFTKYDGTEQGRIWISGGIGMIRFSGSDASKTLIHSGNIGSQSVNYANSAGLVAWNNVSGKPSTFTPAAGSDNYIKVYNSSNVVGSASVTVNDLAKQGFAAAMIHSSTDNPFGASGWFHALSMAWGTGDNENWISQIALGVEQNDGMWYRSNAGSCIGKPWKRVLDSSNYSSYALPLSGGTVGQTTFYGPYGDPRGVIIREGSLSSTAHNSNSAAPTLNFWWEGKCQGSLLMNSSGNYYLTIEGNRAYLDANVPYATAADTANSATSATYSTYAGTTWTATCQGLKWRRICYVATDIGIVGTSGILNIRATRGNFVVNASFMICSSHSKQCQIVQLSSTYYSTVNIRGVVDSNGNFYIELYDDEVSIASGTNQTYYCSWLPLTRNSITVYTGATSGTTVPDGFAVSTGFRTAPGPYVVGNFVTHNFGSSLPSSAPYGAIFYKT